MAERTSFRWSVVTDPINGRNTIVVPARLPKHVRIVRKVKHHYLHCNRCGAERRVTKFKNGPNARARTMLCVGAQAWATEKHGHGASSNG